MSNLQIILPVLTAICIGVLCREKQIIQTEGIDGLQAFVMNFALPFSLFQTFYKTQVTLPLLLLPLSQAFIVILDLYLGKILCRSLRIRDFSAPYLIPSFEVGLLGYSLLSLLAGSDNMAYLALMDAGLAAAMFTVYFPYLRKQQGCKGEDSSFLKIILSSRCFMAIIIGLLVNISGLGNLLIRWNLNELIDPVTSFIGQATSPVILLILGYGLRIKEIRWNVITKITALRLILHTIICGGLLLLFHIIGGIFASPLMILSVIILFITPPSFLIPLYLDEQKEKEYCSSMITASTLITLLLYVVLAILYPLG